MSIDTGRIVEQLNAFWDNYATALIVTGGLAVLLALVLVVRALWRSKSLNAKKTIGFGVVQAGVTFIVVTGVYDFFHLVLDMPVIEAAVLAVFIEGATWGAVGFIYAHGKTENSTGFGDAGPFFWFSVIGGGTLAVLGGSSSAVAVGRVVIVALGAYMWYLQLLQVTHRSGKRSRWRWTPRRLLLAIGAMAPADEDVTDEAREWQVRRLARAIRWANSGWPWSWLGAWTLTRRAEATTEDVLAEARRRWAAAHVLREQTRASSPVMAAVITAVEEAEISRVTRAGSPLAIAQEESVTDSSNMQQVPDTPAELLAPPTPVGSPAVADAAPAPERPVVPQQPIGGRDRGREPAYPAYTGRPQGANGRRHPSATDAGVSQVHGTMAMASRPAPAPMADSDNGSGELPLKVQAFALLDEEVRGDDPHSTHELAEFVVGRLGGKVATASRYVRDWRNEVAAGQRPQALAKRLRVVAGR